ncbi:OmpP1/FadL family transporter [Alkalilimnicola ehrlichii]|uniref:OmpP1/FadL family transporter n=1 Tax=Alkalilimnicola ehrlichii TaxID=351052 RepID=UPI0015F299D7|nr:outer membrane protein transport protein [Alkalilimnicola ehrlichii]
MLISLQAVGAGFELPSKGIKEMGIAYSGSAALLEDASAVAHNPAGLLRLQGRQVSGGLTIIRSGFDYEAEAHREMIESIGGQVPGEGEGSISASSVAPHLYYSHTLSEAAAVGFGIYVPFASTTDYGDEWVGRYHATETEITTINLNPALAVRITDTLGVGIGGVAQYFDGRFQNKIDLGYLVADELIAQLHDAPLVSPNEAAIVDSLAHQFDVDNDMSVDSWAYGFNLGLLWEPSQATRIGFNYQSRVRHVADGQAKRPQTLDEEFRQRLEDAIDDNMPGLASIFDPNAAANGANRAVGPLGAAGGDIRLVTDMPEIVTLSVYQALGQNLALVGGSPIRGGAALASCGLPTSTRPNGAGAT